MISQEILSFSFSVSLHRDQKTSLGILWVFSVPWILLAFLPPIPKGSSSPPPSPSRMPIPYGPSAPPLGISSHTKDLSSGI